MRISDFARITSSEIVNTGDIDSFEGISFDSTRISRQNLYIHKSTDNQALKKAVENLCYAVLFIEDIPILDDQIAWIKTDNITKSLISFIKYKNLNSRLIYLDDICFDIIKSICIDKDITFVEGDLTKVFNKTINSEDKITNIKELSSISNNIESKNNVKIEIIKKSLFSTVINYKDTLFDIAMPYIYIPKLIFCISLLEDMGLKYDISNCTLEKCFKIVFVDNRLNIKKYGSTSKAIIFQQDEFFDESREYLETYAKWANIDYIRSSSNSLSNNFNYVLTTLDIDEFFKAFNKNTQIEKNLFTL
ncbi:MAG: Unknown protein [uncultured Campylobacterales bacterium]|uniref:Uncharacterized protein n=1 Tax=uncultured Campylobacterales bacterium TaxID=352960 RepID=A0A6S6S686_9BACT|nr:MAG: Unknown protein [uncultured Campylobacterales bacterium]